MLMSDIIFFLGMFVFGCFAVAISLLIASLVVGRMCK